MVRSSCERLCSLACEILGASVEERRKSQRENISQTAYVSHMGFSTRCTIVNISQEGAAIEVSDATSIPKTFKLMTANDRVVRNCQIVWIKRNTLGLEFDNAVTLSNRRVAPLWPDA